MTEPHSSFDLEGFKQFETDSKYLNAHSADLRHTYPNCHVAVYKEQVVGADPDLKNLLKALKEKGVPLDSIAHRFIADPPRFLVL